MESTTSLDDTHLKCGTRCVFRQLTHEKSKNGFILCSCDVFMRSQHAENIENDRFTLKIDKPHQAQSILRRKLILTHYYSNENYGI